MKALIQLPTLLVAAALASNAVAGSSSSASYAVQPDLIDAGGGHSSSAHYANDGCVGGFGGSVTAASAESRGGFLGQLYEVTGIEIFADAASVDEGDARQFAASALLDDASTVLLAGSEVTWAVLSGPIASVDGNGLGVAENVYQDTPASVQGSYQGMTASLGLLVINVGNDDFGGYAADGLEDSWQVQHFSLNDPNAGPGADPDADGQNNGYEYVVGSIPTDGASYFRFRIEPVPAQPGMKNLIFSPRVPGRTYTVQYKVDLGSPGFADLVNLAVSDAGLERTVTDLNATESNKFYRVQITAP